ncbi:MAG: hypothetical protein V5B33_00225 [Candidatus Accumulibacter sp. UW20]|jgi:hypothetical protein
MPRIRLLDAAIVLGLVALGVAGHQLAPLLNPKSDLALPLSTCNLGEQVCVTTLPDGAQVEFSIEPRPIPVLAPLQLQASFRGVEVRKVEVDFAGTEMEMGYNRQQLQRQGESSERFSATASLAVCVTGRMEWQATLVVDTGKAVIAIPFRFVSGH